MDSNHDPRFQSLVNFLCRVPAVSHNSTPSRGIGSGWFTIGWWVKFGINIEHPLAWNVVQGLGFVLNYISLNERLPTVFMPVSPAPYLNGGPREFLDWVIECRTEGFSPNDALSWLESHLPKPVEDEEQWRSVDQ